MKESYDIRDLAEQLVPDGDVTDVEISDGTMHIHYEPHDTTIGVSSAAIDPS